MFPEASDRNLMLTVPAALVAGVVSLKFTVDIGWVLASDF
jgi:hypothetical protein